MSHLSPIPYRVPMVDPRTGLVNRNWAQWFENMLMRIGGAGNTATIDELESSVEADTPIESVVFVHSLQRQLADVEMLSIFSNTPQAQAEESSPFEGATVAEVGAIREAIRNLEALTVWSW